MPKQPALLHKRAVVRRLRLRVCYSDSSGRGTLGGLAGRSNRKGCSEDLAEAFVFGPKPLKLSIPHRLRLRVLHHSQAHHLQHLVNLFSLVLYLLLQLCVAVLNRCHPRVRVALHCIRVVQKLRHLGPMLLHDQIDSSLKFTQRCSELRVVVVKVTGPLLAQTKSLVLVRSIRIGGGCGRTDQHSIAPSATQIVERFEAVPALHRLGHFGLQGPNSIQSHRGKLVVDSECIAECSHVVSL
mmetsp:Transcript_28430/g.74696  ORF Transcript_28430/g.74696 Transcript_28430/m.74696 type:complete len:240 (-) Transcript_28430:335-1054(-)